MKLIRLESDTVLKKSQFCNKLAVPLVLGKNSKVALKTLSMEFETPFFVVDNTNNEFKFKLNDDDGYATVTIANGQYSASSLATAVQNALNLNLNYVDLLNGSDVVAFEWKVDVDGDLLNGYHLNIMFNRNDVLEVTDAECDLVDVEFTDAIFQKGTIDNGTFNSYMFCNHDLCRGGWVLKSGVTHASGTTDDISDSRWFMYLDVNQSTLDVTDESDLIDKMICGFGVSDNGTYTYKKNGSMVDTNITVSNTDEISISNNYGQIKYIISVTTEPFEFDGDFINNVYPNFGSSDINVFIKFGDDTGNIGFTSVFETETPFATLQNGIYKPLNTVESVKRNLNIKADPTNVTLYFDNDNCRVLLGYLDNTYSQNLLSGEFTAEASLKSNILENDATVELLELSTGGYDHAYRMNRNIIGVITSADLKQSISTGADTYKLSFKEEFQNFINISNFASSLSVNSITVRVSVDGQPLPIIGKMTCGLFFTYDED